MKLTLIFGLILVIGLGANKPGMLPDFSGNWVLNKEKSNFGLKQAKKIEKGTVQIDHKEPLFKFNRTFVTGGKEDQLSYELNTDGKEVEKEEGGMKTLSKLYWSGDTLICETKMIMGDRQATNIVHYTIEDGGKALIAREKFRGPKLQYDNLWYFEKQ